MAISAPAQGLPPRIQRLLQAAHSSMLDDAGHRVLRFVFDAGEYLDKEQLRIASYRETDGQPMCLRRARAFYHICAHWRIAIPADELVVGSQRGNIWWRGLRGPTTPQQDERHAHVQQAYQELGIAFGEGHVVCDYPRVLREGLRAQVDRIDELLRGVGADDPRHAMWEAMKITCEAARLFARRYAQAARDLAQQEDARRSRELLEIAQICERVPWEPARTLGEAIQSFWLMHVLLHVESPQVAYSPGRMDQYLYPFYRDDLEAGRCSREQAAEKLACLWLKFWQGDESQNLVIGGIDADGCDATNELSYLMLDLTRELRAFQPSVSVRLHAGAPARLWDTALELARTGLGQPSMFNDEVVRAALESIGVPAQEAWDWAIVGCYEAVVAGAEWGRTVACGVVLPMTVTKALRRRPAEADELWRFTLQQLGADIDAAVQAANSHEEHQARHAPSPFQSVLMRDCIDKGLDVYSGGARHNFSACWAGSIATAADALAAVRRLIFQEGALSVDQLADALDRDFDGTEDVRQLLVRRAPKFGNDDDEVDGLARELAQAFCARVTRARNPRGGSFQPSLGMYQVHYRGLDAPATPDGRHAGVTFSAGVGPTQGYNDRGVTATLASCAKLPHELAPDGNFLIISLQPGLLAGGEGLQRLAQLVRTYFEQGGSHVMVNVVDVSTLRDARVHPERHRDLMVRISGLSAYFVALAGHIQDDIINRTAGGL